MSPAGAAGHRGDIDGLRAVAIVVVVLFHAGVPGFRGGFVGVDVFFVVSGWLITRQLLEPSASRPRGWVLDFLARRVRRLVPASVAMIVGTLAASALVLAPMEWQDVAERGAAAALYVSNVVFAVKAGDYFSGPLQESPFLHTWSLGVEEQFYLVWPLLLGAVAVVAARRGGRPGPRPAVVATAGVMVVSFGLSVALTSGGSPWAFYGLPARAWELAVGGVAVTAVAPLSWNATGRAAAAITGLGLIGAGVVLLDADSAVPGPAAAVPVTGALLVLLAGHHDSSVPGHGLLDVAPLRALGRLSYSWYLWHWPAMVLAVPLLSENSVAVRLGAALSALVVAWLSWVAVERPVRGSARLTGSRGATFAVGAALTLFALGASAALWVHAEQTVSREPWRGYESARQSFRIRGCTEQVLAGVPTCVSGEPTWDRTVVLVGDSHAGQWMGTFAREAVDRRVRVVLRQAGGCPATPPPDPVPSRLESCRAFQRDTERLVAAVRPDAVVLTDAVTTRTDVFGEDGGTWAAAVSAQVRDLLGRGIGVGTIQENPAAGDPILCVARGRSEDDCTPTRVEAVSPLAPFAAGERALTRAGVPSLGTVEDICGPHTCPIRTADGWVFAAAGHLTAAYTDARAADVGRFLDAVLDR